MRDRNHYLRMVRTNPGATFNAQIVGRACGLDVAAVLRKHGDCISGETFRRLLRKSKVSS
jgi:hypothetical protein